MQWVILRENRASNVTLASFDSILVVRNVDMSFVTIPDQFAASDDILQTTR